MQEPCISIDKDVKGSLPTISVIVPVYNSEGSLAELMARLEATLRPLSSQLEVILVNDGSRDRSWQIICQLARQHHSIRGFNLLRNYGQQNALLCGIRMAHNDIIVTLDDDLQHPPEEIPRMLQKLAEGYDVVYGSPATRRHGLWRNLTASVAKLALQGALRVSGARTVSAFRVFRTQLRDAFANYQSPYVSINVLLTWGTTRFASIPVRHDERKIGASNYNFRKLVTQAVNLITGFSVVPLQIASVVGFLFTSLGIGVLLYVLVRYVLQGASVPGFTFLASLIAIFSGAQLFALGIIGEYLARMHQRAMERPVFVVRSSTEPANRAPHWPSAQEELGRDDPCAPGLKESK